MGASHVNELFQLGLCPRGAPLVRGQVNSEIVCEPIRIKLVVGEFDYQLGDRLGQLIGVNSSVQNDVVEEIFAYRNVIESNTFDLNDGLFASGIFIVQMKRVAVERVVSEQSLARLSGTRIQHVQSEHVLRIDGVVGEFVMLHGKLFVNEQCHLSVKRTVHEFV